MSNLAWVNNKELNDSEFYNRTEEISNIKALLNLTANGNAPSLLVTGIRNVGKTVFLNKIKKDMENEYLIIYMDFSRAECYQKNNMNPTGLLEYYYKETINECKKKNLVNFDYRLKKYFKTNDFHIKDIKKIDILPLPIISSEKNFENLKDFIFNLPNEIYNDYKDTIKGIIIIIDEIQVIKELNEYLESFLWILRSYTQKHNHIAYVFSGSMSLQDELIPQISSQNGAFGGRMINIQLDPFTKETTKNYLNKNANDLILTEEAFERFYKCTSGIPAYINIFGTLLPKNVQLNEKMIIENFDKNITSIIFHLINLWNKLSKKEKDIFISLLDKPLKRKEIANNMGVTTGSLSNSLKKLQKLDLITIENNLYTIKEKLLARWLKKEYETYGVYPYIIN
ncbi:MAG: hypothetical protein BZ133_00560 [Methanosphaera sp. SHI613]|jgi:AAA+ ATPase superfamily predicted ATPase|nr:MAG: hypothetical protein BZ133_00560 [Methanosphaera sp. SHI613]